ncbi:MAG TPA: Uma2 family endonuclease [Longimicrobiaceae bacterium]|nr:Uma2 family endonuclease [Longimicrobiaceae bacterium]
MPGSRRTSSESLELQPCQLAFNPDTVRSPHIAFVCRERDPEASAEDGYCGGAPDLAVEVVSPTDSFGYVEAKVLDWLTGGCRMVLVVNSDTRTVTMYRSRTDIEVLVEDEWLDGGDVVPGWRLPIRELFD